MFNGHFYHAITRKSVAVFGTLFNNITIAKQDVDGTLKDIQKVPLAYGPRQKFLARIDEQANLTDPKVAIKLPRMSFEITNMQYDSIAAQSPHNKITTERTATSLSTVKAPAPYLLDFQLNILAKNQDDALQILEQIIPTFKPTYTVSVNFVDGVPSVDVPITLQSVSLIDDYEGDYTSRRVLMYTLDFQMKIRYFSGFDTAGIITKVITNFIESDNLKPIETQTVSLDSYQYVARAESTISGSELTSINITHGGRGYLTAPTVTIDQPSGGYNPGTSFNIDDTVYGAGSLELSSPNARHAVLYTDRYMDQTKLSNVFALSFWIKPQPGTAQYVIAHKKDLKIWYDNGVIKYTASNFNESTSVTAVSSVSINNNAWNFVMIERLDDGTRVNVNGNLGTEVSGFIGNLDDFNQDDLLYCGADLTSNSSHQQSTTLGFTGLVDNVVIHSTSEIAFNDTYAATVPSTADEQLNIYGVQAARVSSFNVKPAEVQAVITNGQVTAVNIIDGGTGYTVPPSIRFSSPAESSYSVEDAVIAYSFIPSTTVINIEVTAASLPSLLQGETLVGSTSGTIGTVSGVEFEALTSTATITVTNVDGYYNIGENVYGNTSLESYTVDSYTVQ